MVTHDKLRIALPSGPGGEDNYVVGLATDFTVDTVGASYGKGHGKVTGGLA